MKHTPHHIAMIMDGNRRWAVQHGLPKIKGHSEGAKAIRVMAQAMLDRNIPYLTLYALSTENLTNRSEKELTHIFGLIERLPKFLKELTDNDVRIRVIGDMSKLPKKTQQVLQTMVNETSDHSKLTLTFAINYGGRDELVRAIQRMIQDNTINHVSETTLEQHLDTAGYPPLDLIIRTGGKQRLSNFLIWQAAYTELYFTNTFWPAFDTKELDQALSFFDTEERNFGS
ncbi:MAG: di-trans,poly-cis-decaprenylcistransferase [Candidatus Magasanikbacteria bacterium]|uniref:Isoprenyl transferase n=1 Tax=Candidatus Magasanikbacteria bacterium CG10_big_fil_rev_8_21_14_0_10_38_6 TaxID=1974647 RepID=A0A2M6P171_9BACT|nr:di-trans,poly-cis-decaprenylcistransferase [Candidatus Magasanikbacteria bacterium]NCS72165.1 di-trans,poly-cis-decaprenylcistransferase [Candidatus Magasanikbacteria bacterium]PIR77451.1 MAG: di-trans,poly-cis-decaprenylcistransferase [Candidatus Magasanikbacteria bacterium CG10_big_fil_rev_8_21_14_0_10_38_6]